MTVDPDETFYASCALKLTRWYDQNKRDLPWRRTRDPYAILVSELMLQQTQVERVKSYFVRWMERLPTFASLAAASEEEIISLWQGLGYYSRARSLQKSAQMLVSDGQETLPADPKYLARLPGLGPYTVGAVCSIAFDLPVPAVDGNVRRVFSRLLDLDADPVKKAGAAVIAHTAESILKHGMPHILTQAFMELGATVCLPNTEPHCDQCPVADFCASFAHGTQMQRPAATPRTKINRRLGAALLIGSSSRGWLIRRRPKGGLWEDFYEIPWLYGSENEDFAGCLERLREQLSIPCPCRDSGIEETMKFTRWQVRVRLYHAPIPAQIPTGIELADTEKMLAQPMPAGIKRLVERALEKVNENQLDLFAPKR